jgi:hypothetical protein
LVGLCFELVSFQLDEHPQSLGIVLYCYSYAAMKA